MRLVLIGNYGVGNIGDELLKEYFLRHFAGHEWWVTSQEQTKGSGACTVPRLPFGVRSLFTPWWKTIWAIARSDAVVFGGGSLFTDVESVSACYLWGWHAFVARLFGKPVLLAFQGIGPFRTGVGERIAQHVCRKAVFISVRDPVSESRIKNWDLNKICIQTFDPVFALYSEEKHTFRTKKVLSIIPRFNSSSSLREKVQETLKNTTVEGVLILSMMPDDPQEQIYCRNLVDSIGQGAAIISIRSLSDLLQYVYESVLVISERYHGALAALAAGVPVDICIQKQGDKLDALREMIEAGDAREKAHHLVKVGEDALVDALRQIEKRK